MPKDHARKRRARRTARSAGSSYTSANAGTLHAHPAPVLITVSGAPFGVSAPPTCLPLPRPSQPDWPTANPAGRPPWPG